MPASHGSVLLVESTQDDREMYAEFLRARHFTAVEVETTDDGLRIAPSAGVIVTGIRVPGSFDGVELVRRLRHSEATRNKPLIVLTACAFATDQNRAEIAGCDVFLPKPCLPQTLLEQIQRLMAHGRALRTASVRGRMRVAKARLRSNELLKRSGELRKRFRKSA